MLNSDVLDVAIGVVLVYLLVSLLCSAVYELIAARMRLRSKDLEDGIRIMLGSPPQNPDSSGGEAVSKFLGDALSFPFKLIRGSHNGEGKNAGGVAQAVFDHPLMRSMKRHQMLPSYVPTHLFSSMLLDVLDEKNVITNLRNSLAEVMDDQAKLYLGALLSEASLEKARSTALCLADRISDPGVRAELQRVVTAATNSHQIRSWIAQANLNGFVQKTVLAALTPASIAEVRAAVAGLPGDSVWERNAKEALSTWEETLVKIEALTRGFGADVKRKSQEVGAWFDDTMDRVTGWYKRRAQLVLIAIAIPIVAALNADTITMAQTLWQDDAVRAALVQEGTGLVTSDTAPACFVPPKPADEGEDEDTRGQSGTEQDNANGDADPEDCADQIRSRLKGLEILGWRDNEAARSDPREVPEVDLSLESLGKWLLKLGGLAITVGAVSQGSQLWFDILKKLVNVRGSGAPPKPASEDQGR